MGKTADTIIKLLKQEQDELKTAQDTIEKLNTEHENAVSPYKEKVKKISNNIEELSHISVPVQYGTLIKNIVKYHNERNEKVWVTSSCDFITGIENSPKEAIKEYLQSQPVELTTYIGVYNRKTNTSDNYYLDGYLPADINKIQADGKSFKEHMQFVKEFDTPFRKQRLTLNNLDSIIVNYPLINTDISYTDHPIKNDILEIIAESEFDEKEM